MFDTASSTDALIVAFGGVGLLVGTVVGAVLVALAGLGGIGFAIKKVSDTIFNMPGGFGYNPRYGSGWSRFRKTNYNGEGGHMKFVKF